LGVVLPGMSLYTGTVRDNLVAEGVDCAEADIWEALAAVNLADTVSRLPRGLDSAVFESGRNFSSGQAQRMLVARSLIRGRHRIFWDEALSGVDASTRESLIRAGHDIASSPELLGQTLETWVVNQFLAARGWAALTTEAFYKFYYRFSSTTGSEDIVVNKDFFTFYNSVCVNFQYVLPVLQIVGL